MLQEKEMTVYLDNSATTRQYDEVTDIMIRYMREQFGNPSSLYRPGIDAEKAVKEARRSLSRAFACGDDEIYFTSGGTESDNTAIFGAAEAGKRRGKRIITTAVEHPAVSEAVKRLEESGFEAVYVPVNKDGILDVSALKDAVNEETVLISVMTVNNENGVIMPISEIAVFKDAYNREHGTKILLHTDAVQAFGKMQVLKSGVDMISVSAHKIHGPKGIGALYIKKGINIRPYIVGGGQEKHFRSGTENVPGIAGLGLATKMIYNDLDMKVALMRELKDYFIEQAGKIENTTVHGLKDEGSAPHIISLGIAGIRSEVLLHTLEDKGIYVSSGSACASNHPAVSGVLRSIGAAQEYLDATIRFSMSEFTTKEEIDYTLETLYNCIPMLRKYTRH